MKTWLRTVAVAGLVMSVLLGTSTRVQAGWSWSIGIGSGGYYSGSVFYGGGCGSSYRFGVHVISPPVYYVPPPCYVPPPVIYVPPPVVYVPPPPPPRYCPPVPGCWRPPPPVWYRHGHVPGCRPPPPPPPPPRCR